MFFLNPFYLLFMAPAMLLVFAAQWWVNSMYRKWSQVSNQSGVSGSEAARRLLQYGGLSGVEIERVQSRLGDHYDPREKKLRLSPGVSDSASVAAVAIAAHEIGHALQDKQNYAPLRFRAALVPAVNLGSTLGWILIIVGLVLQSTIGQQIAVIGLAAFALGAIFALATLPVELNASARAKELLASAGIIQGQREREGVNSVLRAAAFTYIAALAAAILQLLYYAFLVLGMGGRRRR
jgi:Zn-dependent membrane protease YugP